MVKARGGGSDEFGSPDPDLERLVEEMTARNLAAYQAQPLLVDEHAGQEENLSHGGYGRRQLFELVQNGADELIGVDAPLGGRIEVVLTEDHLYCANEGTPITDKGVNALLLAQISSKRGSEIGRFGLGFKSVLGVSSCPEFYSRSVSFGFDEVWAKKTISEVVPGVEAYPVMRTSRLLDATDAAASDQILGGLMAWATSVVRLPLDRRSEWLSGDLAAFESEFLLFSPHVGSLVLDDRTTGNVREIAVSEEGPARRLTPGDRRLDIQVREVTLGEGGASRVWKVFETAMRPSSDARRDAGKLAHREELPVLWAVPTEGKLEEGKFWAFFPLRDRTTLSGIANAPWQINDDRTGLLEGSLLNEELLGVLVDMALDAIPDLVRSDDPGAVLDILPARGREARCWGDDVLTTMCHSRESERPLVPDQDSVPRCVREVEVASLVIPFDALRAWGEHPCRPADWAHSSAYSTPTRRNRLERILRSAGMVEAPVRDWIELLTDVPDVGPDASASAIHVAALIAQDADAWAKCGRSIRSSHIVLCADGDLARLDPEWVWIEPVGSEREPLVRTVHPGVVATDGLRHDLEVLAIEEVTPELELQVMLEEAKKDDDWDLAWVLTREIQPPQRASEILRAAWTAGRPFRVRVVSGELAAAGEVLLPGRIVEEESPTDPAVVVDIRYHAEDLEVLRLAGVGTGPSPGWTADDDRTLHEYQQHCIGLYLKDRRRDGSNPSRDLVDFDEVTAAGPLSVLTVLSDEAKARFVDELLAVGGDLTPWTVRHKNVNKYPAKYVEHPVVWAIRNHGLVRTSLGPRRTDDAVSPTLAPWSEVLPVAQIPKAAAAALELPSTLELMSEHQWDACFDAVARSTDDRQIGGFYVMASGQHHRVPDLIRCRVGSTHELRPPEEVTVTDRQDTFEALRAIGTPTVLVADREGSTHLVGHWGLNDATGQVRHEPNWVADGDEVPLVDAFPTLREDLAAAELADATLVPCAELRMSTTTSAGTTDEDRDYFVDGDRILYRSELGYEFVLRELSRTASLELSEDEIGDLTEQRWRQDRRRRFVAIREAASDADRLIKAIGIDLIRSRLPVGLIDAVRDLGGDPTDQELAQLLLVVHGYDTLKNLKDDLAAAGLDPPTTWAGSSNARRFVRDLGFPDAYAGFRSSGRDAVYRVPGPTALPPLHDYQRRMVEEIRELVERGGTDPRGLLSLPTGAGKTRVAVEALVHSLVDDGVGSPILWIAQSDELCEQAVQAWAQVWRSEGDGNDLTISRLWGPTNEAEEALDGHQVVVATPDKLRGRVDTHDYEWLSQAGCVVIDEAHGATTPEYTKILEWEGILMRGRTTKTRCPLIGLSATPFRGTSKEQTERLVARFGRRRLDVGMSDKPYQELQELGVLSRVEGDTLEGMVVDVDESIAREYQKFGDMPKTLFRAIASDADRNRRIINSITEMPADWPILLFAVSTEHAHTMAALLSNMGIRSAAIDYETDSALRRKYVEEFRGGDLRVLCNYNVLSQGFDAPAVRAIYVTRPTFSPNIYQQMIGRGLRGPLNGGKELCLIVNVLDNWSRFGEELAYREFEYLWDDH